MSKKINAEELPDFDLAEHLKTDEDIATYLSVVLEDDDSSELMHALGVLARSVDDFRRPEISLPVQPAAPGGG